MRGKRRAFTLIELLVVVAIIALLISILLPSLQSAREQAKRAKCGVQLRAIGTGIAAYGAEENEWIPGRNTTGINLQIQYQDPSNDQLEVLRKGSNPVQYYDWLSPVLGYDTELGTNRAERWRTAVDYYACPSNVGLRIDTFFGLDAEVDKADILKEMNRRPYRPISYLMPFSFQTHGLGAPTIAHQYPNGTAVSYARPNSSWEYEHPDYRPQLGRVGMPARKLLAADGTRYLDADLQLDFDFKVTGGLFGAFTSAGGWWTGSRAYGVAQGSQNWDGSPVSEGSPSRGNNLPLTYRHTSSRNSTGTTAQTNPGSINGLFFDGHVAAMSDRESRNVEFWYPKGTRIKSHREGMTDVPRNFRVP